MPGLNPHHPLLANPQKYQRRTPASKMVPKRNSGQPHQNDIKQKTKTQIIKKNFGLTIFAYIALLHPLHAENALMQIHQPTSLLGTEMDGDPLGTGKSIAATIVSRPILVGGAYPESPVDAISLPHRIAGAGKGFPDESNLIVLVGGKIVSPRASAVRNFSAPRTVGPSSPDGTTTTLHR